MRVYGPYEDKRNGTFFVRVEWRDERGRRRTERHSYQTREKAERRATREREALARPEETTVQDALDQWIAERRAVVKDAQRPKTMLAALLDPDLAEPIARLSEERAEALYDRLTSLPVIRGGRGDVLVPRSAAYHQAALSIAREWGRWLQRKRLALVNPFANVQKMGRAKAGAESKVWLDPAQLGEWARAAEAAIREGLHGEGGLAAYLIYALALRASEPGSMHALEPRRPATETTGAEPAWARFRVKGSRRQRIRHVRRALPDWLAPLFEGRAKAGLPLLKAKRDTVRKAVTAICKRAGVPMTCPHGLRESVIDYQAAREAQDGTLDRRMLDRMAVLHGHTAAVAERHYMAPGRMEEAAAAQHLKVIQGGKVA